MAGRPSFEEFRAEFEPWWVTWRSEPVGSTALIGATHNNVPEARWAITSFLLDEGADPSVRSRSSTPQHGLCGARSVGEQDAVLLARLFDGGAGVNTAIEKFGRPLQLLLDWTYGPPFDQVGPMLDVFFSRDDLDLLAVSKRTGWSFAWTILQPLVDSIAIRERELGEDVERRIRAYLSARGIDADEVLMTGRTA